jgi:hypothetical protein
MMLETYLHVPSIQLEVRHNGACISALQRSLNVSETQNSNGDRTQQSIDNNQNMMLD